MIRAVQTGDIVKDQLEKELPVSIDPLLCEGVFLKSVYFYFFIFFGIYLLLKELLYHQNHQ
jgi:hypothetical protein